MSPSIHAEDGKVNFAGEHNSVTLRVLFVMIANAVMHALIMDGMDRGAAAAEVRRAVEIATSAVEPDGIDLYEREEGDICST